MPVHEQQATDTNSTDASEQQAPAQRVIRLSGTYAQPELLDWDTDTNEPDTNEPDPNEPLDTRKPLEQFPFCVVTFDLYGQPVQHDRFEQRYEAETNILERMTAERTQRHADVMDDDIEHAAYGNNSRRYIQSYGLAMTHYYIMPFLRFEHAITVYDPVESVGHVLYPDNQSVSRTRLSADIMRVLERLSQPTDRNGFYTADVAGSKLARVILDCAGVDVHRFEHDKRGGNYVAVSDTKGHLTYLPATKLLYHSKTGNECKNHPGRRHASPKRVFCSVFPELTDPHELATMQNSNDVSQYTFTDSDWEAVTIKLLALQNTDITYRLLTGRDIQDAYYDGNVSDLGRTGGCGSSCMRYSHCREYLALYAENPKQVQLLVSVDSQGLTVSRALLWKLDSGSLYLDRIYAPSDTARIAFWEYAQASFPTITERYADYHTGGCGTSETVTLDTLPSTGEYPYMDSFGYLDPDSGVLSCTEQGTDNEWALHSQSGGYDVVSGAGCWHDYTVTMTRVITRTVIVTASANADRYDIESEAADIIDSYDDDSDSATDWELADYYDDGPADM